MSKGNIKEQYIVSGNSGVRGGLFLFICSAKHVQITFEDPSKLKWSQYYLKHQTCARLYLP